MTVFDGFDQKSPALYFVPQTLSTSGATETGTPQLPLRRLRGSEFAVKASQSSHPQARVLIHWNTSHPRKRECSIIPVKRPYQTERPAFGLERRSRRNLGGIRRAGGYRSFIRAPTRHVPGEKYLSRSGLRRSKLHIIRFGPADQSLFISLLLLFKIEASLQF